MSSDFIERARSRVNKLDAEIQAEANDFRTRMAEAEEAALQRKTYLETVNNVFFHDLVPQVLNRSRIKEIFSEINKELLDSKGRIVDKGTVYTPREVHHHTPSGEWSETRGSGGHSWTYVKPAEIHREVSLVRKDVGSELSLSFLVDSELKEDNFGPVLVGVGRNQYFRMNFEYNSLGGLNFIGMVKIPPVDAIYRRSYPVKEDTFLSETANWQEVLGDIYSDRAVEYIKILKARNTHGK